MNTRACESQDVVTRTNFAAVDNLRFFDNTHTETSQIIVSFVVHARHFCGFTANQCSTRDFAAPGDSRDD